MKKIIYLLLAISLIACKKKEEVKPIEQPVVIQPTKVYDTGKYIKLYINGELKTTKYIEYSTNNDYKPYINITRPDTYYKSGYNNKDLTDVVTDYKVVDYYYLGTDRYSVIEGTVTGKIGNENVRIEFKWNF